MPTMVFMNMMKKALVLLLLLIASCDAQTRAACQLDRTVVLRKSIEGSWLNLMKPKPPPSQECVLWLVKNDGSRVTIARSYNGGNWEGYGSASSNLRFRCPRNLGSCGVRLPVTTNTNRYELVATRLTSTPIAAPTPVPPTIVSPVAAPPVAVPPTNVAPVAAPPVAAPPTNVAPVAAPPVAVPPTNIAPVAAPPVAVPPTNVAPVAAPPTMQPPVAAQPTTVSGPSVSCQFGKSVALSDYKETSELRLANTKSSPSEVCMLWRVTSGGARVPVARSYDGNNWEAYSGTYSTLKLQCSAAVCQTRLPATTDTQRYELVSYQRRALSKDETAARFLEQTTFGPRLDEIKAFPDVSTQAFAQWIMNQSNLPITSHRAEFRKVLNRRFSIQENTLEKPSSGVCSSAPPTFLNEAACVISKTSSCVQGGVSLICGSPFEVANNATLAASLPGGGFELVTAEGTSTHQHRIMEQNSMIWMDVALNGKDQLRQRIAWALSQILVVAPYALESWYTNEVFLAYYDIFVRNAFGNYRDILKEVSYSPAMAEMLSFLNSQSTAKSWEYGRRYEFADENFAREIMQLFSIGLYQLNQDGTLLLDGSSNRLLTYTNDDIMEYARMWTGFKRQPRRKNIEDFPSPWTGSLVDPMMIDFDARDSLPKMGLNRVYVGDGYPLCADLPSQHFLKRGATYRLLGPTPKPRLLNDPESWTGSKTKKRLVLNTASNLYQALCRVSGGSCTYPSTIVLQSNLACTGIECNINEPRIVEVSGMYYEYTRLPCVEQAFYSNSVMMTNQWGWTFCGDRRTASGSVACCPDSTGKANTGLVQFDGEKMTFDTAVGRCKANSMAMCEVPWWECNGCHERLGYWTTHSCNLVVKVHRDGKIGLVHEVIDSRPNVGKNMHYNVRKDTKTSFRVDWEGSVNTLLNSYNTQCVAMGCKLDSAENVCLCPASVTESQVFNSAPSVTDVLRQLPIGSFSPDLLAGGYKTRDLGGGVLMYSTDGMFSAKSIFQVKDANGVTHLRKNVKSTVRVGSGALSFRNPPHFVSLAFPELRDAVYETDAGLDHYFYHPSMAPFLASRMLQRFGFSNPSPRMISTAASAFRTGVYSAGGRSFGSGKYGDMLAMMSAILLDRESRATVLDADPLHGSLQEPFLRYVRAMRSLEFKPTSDAPHVRFKTYFPISLGQSPHMQLSVFSFFKPEYSPPGPVGNAGLFCPECQLTDGPKAITLMNALNSLLKYGLSSDYGGFGYGRGRTPSKGDYSNSFGSLTLKLSDSWDATRVVDELAMLLTAGRLDAQKRRMMVDVFNSLVSRAQGIITVEQLMLTTPEFHTNTLSQNSGGAVAPPSSPVQNTKPYKAVIFVMLSGGYDSFNMLVPQVCTGKNSAGVTVDQQYNAERGALALPSGDRSLQISAAGQPCSRFTLHKELPLFKSLYDAGDLTFVANMGVLNDASGMDKVNYMAKTRIQLFAHNWMQQETKTMDPKAQKFGTGVLGRMNSVLKDKGYTPGSVSFDSESIAIEPERNKTPRPLVISPYGASTFDAKPSSDTFDLTSYAKRLNARPNSTDSLFGQTWSARFLDGMDQATFFKSKIEQAPLGNHWSWDISHLGFQFRMLSQLVKSRSVRGVDRDVFYTEFANWDHHARLASSLETNFKELNKSLNLLVTELKLQGVWNDVTIVIGSEFGRTLTGNSGGGSDHAWGGNYALMGGALAGGKILGQYPSDLTERGPLNVGRGRFIPTTSWDAVWNGVAQWMGVTNDAELDYCLPNRKSTAGVSGFTNLFSASDLYQSSPRKRHLRQGSVDEPEDDDEVRVV